MGQTQVSFFLLYTVEAQFVLGTNEVCPWDKPNTKGGRARRKDDKEGRKKENNKTETETETARVARGGKKASEKQKKLFKINKMPFFSGETGFLCKKERETNRKQNKKQTKNNKDGVGPSELALWATSPDP